MWGLAASEHLHELLDPPGSGLGTLGFLYPVEDGEPVCARQRIPRRLRLWRAGQGIS
jgi:hypothetical protein